MGGESADCSPAFKHLLIEHVLAAHERQMRLAEVVDGRNWSVDLDERSIVFGDELQVAADLIGSESSTDGSWLWAWSNPSLDFPQEWLAPSLRLAELGRAMDVRELAEGRLAVSPLLSAHPLGAVASGLLDADAYFVAPNGPVSALLTLRGPELRLGPPDALGLTRTLTGGLGEYGLDHKPVIAAFLARRGASVEPGEYSWRVMLPSGEQLQLRFDELQRLAETTSELGNPAAGSGAPGRRRWRDRFHRG